MPNVELTDEELAELRELQKSREGAEGVSKPQGARRPQDRKRPASKPSRPAAPEGPRDFSASVWGQVNTEDLQVPSGQWCKVRQVGAHELISQGVIDNVDSLTNIVQNELIADAEGKPTTQVDPKELGKNLGALKQLMDVSDKIALFAVVEPRLYPIPYEPDGKTPIDITDRDSIAGVWVDQVGIEDKVFIMQFVMGGVRELEGFRPGS